MTRRILTLMTAAGVLVGCGDGTGVDGAANLSIAFATPSTTAAGQGVSASLVPSTSQSITVSGSNGTLTIDEIFLIVAEFELEGELTDCAALTEEEKDEIEECQEFESPPSLIQLPVDGTPLQVVSDVVPLGTYTDLGWAVENLSLDDVDDDEQEIQAVAAEIEAMFGAGVWPAEASMAVTGSFLAEGETTPTEFTTFFNAEIGVWIELIPALEITEDGASRELTIVLSPEVWFQNADGTVMDLAALAGALVEFEAEFEEGVIAIERDDD